MALHPLWRAGMLGLTGTLVLLVVAVGLGLAFAYHRGRCR